MTQARPTLATVIAVGELFLLSLGILILAAIFAMRNTHPTLFAMIGPAQMVVAILGVMLGIAGAITLLQMRPAAGLLFGLKSLLGAITIVFFLLRPSPAGGSISVLIAEALDILIAIYAYQVTRPSNNPIP